MSKGRMGSVGLPSREPALDPRRVLGGLLAQEWDLRLDRAKYDAVTKRKPTEEEWKALLLAWTVAKHVKSTPSFTRPRPRPLAWGRAR